MLAFVLLILGFVLIIKAADLLVDASVSIATHFKVPKMLIALTIVSFGTCAPEVAISFQSVASRNGTIAFANIVGSCIVNVFLIIGLASVLRAIRVKHRTVKKELPILVIITAVFSVLMLDSLFNPLTPNDFSRSDGIILVLFFSMFVLYLISLVRKGKEDHEEEAPKYSIAKSLVFLLLSLVVITFSSDLIVDNAQKIALSFGISEKIITMVFIVIGTSLPEMFMTVSSARKGEFDLAIGNIIGTNIFNICIVLGLPVALYGKVPLTDFSFVDVLAVMGSSLLLYLFSKNDRCISKKEGFSMIFIFVLYYLYVFFC